MHAVHTFQKRREKNEEKQNLGEHTQIFQKENSNNNILIEVVAKI